MFSKNVLYKSKDVATERQSNSKETSFLLWNRVALKIDTKYGRHITRCFIWPGSFSESICSKCRVIRSSQELRNTLKCYQDK